MNAIQNKLVHLKKPDTFFCFSVMILVFVKHVVVLNILILFNLHFDCNTSYLVVPANVSIKYFLYN